MTDKEAIAKGQQFGQELLASAFYGVLRRDLRRIYRLRMVAGIMSTTKVEYKFAKYRCHKEVEAFQIVQIDDCGKITSAVDPCGIVGTFRIWGALHCGEGARVAVDAAWIEKHEPVVGGYFVIYEDGYTSFSPKEAFEKGYSKIEVSA